MQNFQLLNIAGKLIFMEYIMGETYWFTKSCLYFCLSVCLSLCLSHYCFLSLTRTYLIQYSPNFMKMFIGDNRLKPKFHQEFWRYGPWNSQKFGFCIHFRIFIFFIWTKYTLVSALKLKQFWSNLHQTLWKCLLAQNGGRAR